MKNKKGFTLIELLAVIVILAIIALIAVPVVLNMVNTAKRKGAIASTYGYIDAVNNYQQWTEFEGKDVLEEGQYNVASKTDSIDKLNDLVRMKGSKPTAGTIYISSSKNVSGATLCYNGFVVQYLNTEAEIIGEECSEIGLMTNIAIENEGWQSEREVIVNYPEGDYKYYFKVSGTSVLTESNESIEKNKDLTATNPLKVTLKENQTLTTWMVKNNKILGKMEYNEEQIDNEVLIAPSVTTTGSYPILTEYGMKKSFDLKITMDSTKNPTSKIQYKLDDGEWVDYTKQIAVAAKKVTARIVKEENGRTSTEVIKDASSITLRGDSVSYAAYDDDFSSYYRGDAYKDKFVYFDIDSSMQGREMIFKFSGNTSEFNLLSYNSSNQTKGIGYTNSNGELIFKVPEDSVKIRIKTYYDSPRIYEIVPYTRPKISYTEQYPKLTIYGMKDPYADISISYDKISVKKEYKIDSGEWKDYQGAIKIKNGETVYARGIDKYNSPTWTASYKSTLKSGSITKNAYDEFPSTYYQGDAFKDKNVYFDIDSSMQGKEVIFKYSGDTKNYNVTSYNAANQTKGLSATNSSGEFFYTIPEDSVKIKIYTYYDTPKISEIVPYTRPKIKVDYVYPKITSTGIEAGYTYANVTYGETAVQKFYKVNDGEWTNYANKKVKLALRDKICTKSVDKYNKTSEEICYTSTLADNAMPAITYDTKDNEYFAIPYDKAYYIDVDSSMEGKSITVLNSVFGTITQLDSNGSAIANGTTNMNAGYTIGYVSNKIQIKDGCKRLKLLGGGSTNKLEIYEIKVDP